MAVGLAIGTAKALESDHGRPQYAEVAVLIDATADPRAIRCSSSTMIASVCPGGPSKLAAAGRRLFYVSSGVLPLTGEAPTLPESLRDLEMVTEREFPGVVSVRVMVFAVPAETALSRPATPRAAVRPPSRTARPSG